VLLMLAGLASAIFRQATGGQAFNLGVDFKGGTVVTVKFKQKPSDEAIRAALVGKGVRDAVVQPVTDKPDTVLIKVPLEGEGQDGRVKVREALNSFGSEASAATELEADQNAAYKIIGTDAVGAIAGAQLRNKAIAVTLAALVGILIYIAFRFEWTYGAAAVIAVFHDVLVTLGFFSIFQFEVSLTVIAALLTLVGFSVNDTIVVFDRIRETVSCTGVIRFTRLQTTLSIKRSHARLSPADWYFCQCSRWSCSVVKCCAVSPSRC
jgi:preprotein translocase subunit SecF